MIAAEFSWQHVRTLTRANIKSRYRNTFAGLLWVVMSPILMFTAQGFAFRFVLKIHYENYPLFLLSGLLPWIFFNTSVVMCTTSMTAQSRLFKSFPLHPLAVLVATILDNLINFALSFVLILVPLVAFTPKTNLLNFALIPVPLLSLFVATVALAWLLASLQVFFWDTKFIVDFVASIAFYLTPIFYPAEFVDPSYRWFVANNPFALLIDPIQLLSRAQLPEDYLSRLALSYLVSLSLLCAAALFWYRKKNSVYFYL